MEKRKGIKVLRTPFNEPDLDKIIVSMIEFQDKIYVATRRGVYVLRDDELVRLKVKDISNTGRAEDV